MEDVRIEIDLHENGASSTVQQLREYLDELRGTSYEVADALRTERGALKETQTEIKELENLRNTQIAKNEEYRARLERLQGQEESLTNAVKFAREAIAKSEPNTVEWEGYTRALQDAEKNLQGVRNQIQAVSTEQQKNAAQSKENSRAQIDQLAKLTAQEAEQKQRISELSIALKTQAKDITAADGSYDQLNATLGRMRDTYRQLSEEQRNSEIGAALLGNIKMVDEQLKEMDASMGNHQRNVGNYASAIEGLFPLQNKMIQQFATFAQMAPTAGAAVNSLTGALKSFGKQLLAIMANPIVATIAIITLAVKGLVNLFKSSEEQTNRLTVAFAPLKVVLDGAVNILQKLSAHIVTLIEGAGKLAAKIMEWAEKIPLIGDSIKDLNAQIADGIALEQERIALAKQTRQDEVDNAQRAYDVAELRAKAQDKEKYTAEERLAFLKQANAKEQEINQSKLDAAQKAYDIAKKEAERTQNDAKTNENLAKLEADLWRVRKEYAEKRRALLGEERTIQNEITAAEKAEADKRARIRKEETDKAIAEEKRKQEELAKLRKAVADVSSGNPDEDEIDRLENRYKEERRIAQEALDKGAIDRGEYDAALLDIDERYFAGVGDLLRQQRADWKESYDAQIADKLEQADELAAIDAQQATLKNETSQNNDNISAEDKLNAEIEYNNRIAEIEYERLQSHIDILQESLANDALNAEEKKRIEQDITAAQAQQLNAQLKAEQANAKAKEKIQKAEVAQRKATVSAIAGLMGSLSQALGEETAAGKAFAVANAIMQTYQAAQGAYTSALVPPAYGPASPYIAALNMATAIGTGIANVRQILTVNPNGENGAGSLTSSTVPQTATMMNSSAMASQLGTDVIAGLQDDHFDKYMEAADKQAKDTRVYVVEQDISDALDSTRVKVENSDF